VSAATQDALKQLACLGNVAKIAALATVRRQTEEIIHAALWEAVARCDSSSTRTGAIQILCTTASSRRRIH
jgi:hypothetical protein